MAQDFIAVNGATMSCSNAQPSYPVSSASLIIIGKTVKADGKDVGNSSDNAATANIPPFGTCSIIAGGNPGTCVPAPIPGVPWSGACSKVKSDGSASLKKGATLNCSIGGTIKIEVAGQTKVKGE